MSENESTEREEAYTASELAQALSRVSDVGGESYSEQYHSDVETVVKEVVEAGTLTPESRIKTDIALTVGDRVSGDTEVDMTSVFLVGMMLGSAFERDVPKDSFEEEVWRNGEFDLSE